MNQTNIADRLLLLTQSHSTGSLAIRSLDLNNESIGMVYFNHGEIVHAYYKSFNGPRAFYELMMLHLPESRWMPHELPDRITMDYPLDKLLFDFGTYSDTVLENPSYLLDTFCDKNYPAKMFPQHYHLKNYNIMLRCVVGQQQDQTFVIEKNNTVIGRDPSCDIVILDPTLSRQHCQLMLDNIFIRIMDLCSTNGTYLNQKTTTESHLKVGDVITMGDTQLRLELKMKRNINMNDIIVPDDTHPNARVSLEGKNFTRKVSLSQQAKEQPSTSTRAIKWENVQNENAQRNTIINKLTKIFDS